MSSTAFPLGAYVGNPNDADPAAEASFEQQLSSFTTTMGAAPQFMNAFVDYGQAPSQWYANQNWWAASWAASPVGHSVTPVIGIPMALNSSWGNQDAFFKAITAGKYDAAYKSIVDAWAGNGYGTMYLRLGYEMNGSFMPWYAGDDAKTQADWVAAFQHLSTLMKQEGTADGANVQIVWNPVTINWTSMDVKTLYPGDKYVDVIATDAYSPEYPLDLTDWASGGKTQDASFAQWSASAVNRQHFWTYESADYWHPTGTPGVGWTLQNTIDFAKLHGKPIALAETGAGGDGTTDGPWDDPAFPAWLYQTLSQPGAPPVAFVNIWDYNTYNGGDNSGNWDFTSTGANRPLEAAAWTKYFGGQSGRTITGSSGADRIYAAIGRQTINAGSGNDAIFIGSDRNVARGDGGTDTITITSGTGNRINGGPGHDTITDNSAGGNTLVLPLPGNQSDDYIYGNVLAKGDLFSVSAALSGTSWNHDLSTAGQYLAIGYDGQTNSATVNLLNGGNAYILARIENSGTVSLANFLTHITA